MLAGDVLHSIFGMPQIAIIMGCLIPIVSIIASFWCKAQNVRSEHELKRSLVDRGLSVDEIERIIAVHSKEPRDSD